ncbi:MULTISPECIES: Nif3-like dinuclear metal center hexameric protein [unclassified Rhodococcus (in: high G+C Gram-positive bacteria)]|uniref:Nif3-like dinuclear metal center hexameric protein n=1 Tax=unclassified Rhodococcus (in: high G+C Gram-positive bacteria) TaxID=192944 RepID=UPI0027E089F0|nr:MULTISPECIES: Nif3-like dinuclear metal center hexameric protein [unclassified Rhodococcus (in: high G+C Gram-positive bacteria)]
MSEPHVSLADVIAVLDRAYPPRLAESWDSVGLVTGDPVDRVRKVVFSVDATAGVVDEAIEWGADLLVVHHPLLMRGVDTVAANTPKGALIHRLVKAGCALFTAHTNADSADPGVSDALADLLEVTKTRPIEPIDGPRIDKWVVFVPTEQSDAVRDALFEAGAGAIGDYRECSWTVAGTGQFHPQEGADPAIGTVGRVERVAEDRVEMVAPASLRAQVLERLRQVHPYEEPAFDILEQVRRPSSTGLGRVGTLDEAVTLRAFAERVRSRLPETAWGVRTAGDPDAVVRTVALCGGAGDSFLSSVGSLGADVYVTADLRHHPVDEHLRAGGPAVIDVAHWASEWPWCAQARAIVDSAFSGTDAWESRVSTTRTDPWTLGAADT